jgi:hypothetical protein
MSGLVDLNLARTFDERSNVNVRRQYSVMQAPNKIFPQQLAANSAQGLAQVSFNPVISDNTILDSCLKVNYRFTTRLNVSVGNTGTPLTFNSANWYSTISKSGLISLRAFPMASVMQAVNLQLNGAGFSSQPYLFISCLERFIDPTKNNYTFSGCPNMRDASQNYSDLTLASATTNRNPMNPYIDYISSASSGEPRGGFKAVAVAGSVAQNTTGNVDITWEVTEPIFCSPLTWSILESVGLANINSLVINLTFLPDMSRVLSYDATNLLANASYQYTINSVSILNGTFDVPPNLLYTSIEPNRNTVIVNPEHFYQYPWNQQQILNSGTVTIAGGATASGFVFPSTSLTGVPQKVYLWASRQYSSLSAAVPDSFAYLKKLSLTFGNSQNLFASTAPVDLYQISCKNGYKQSWTEHSMYVGGPLCLEFGSDIQLDDGDAPGVQGKYTFSFTCDIQNLDPSNSQTLVVYALFVYPGIIEISKGQCKQVQTPLTQSMVLATQANPEIPLVPYSRHTGDVMGGSLLGGGWFDWVKNAANKVADVGRSAYGAVKSGINTVAPLAQQALQVASMIPGVGQYADEASKGLDAVRGFIGSGLRKLRGRGLTGGSATSDLTDEEMLALEAFEQLPPSQQNAIMQELGVSQAPQTPSRKALISRVRK